MGNNFLGSRHAVQKFASSLNSSRVQTLVLTNNEMLSDGFVTIFLKQLNSPYLREIQLSSIGLTHLSLFALSRFLSSPACYGLRTLHVNGNSLSNRGLKKLISDLRVSNTTLCSMEAYANSVAGAEEEDESGDLIPDEALAETTRQALTFATARNRVYLRKVEVESKALLVLARALLGAEHHEHPSCLEQPVFPWRRLAPELQCYILRFTHTALSDAQHARVCKYASDRSTLPPCLSFSRRLKTTQDYIEDFLIQVGCNRFEGVLP